MIFKRRQHKQNIYNTLLFLSRNILFYKNLGFEDTYETRIYLMFFHYSIILLILKNKEKKKNQENYDDLFYYIENNLREKRNGEVSVNIKMKDLNSQMVRDLMEEEKIREDLKKSALLNYSAFWLKKHAKLVKKNTE